MYDTHTPNTVVTFRLVTGEEIVAQYLGYDSSAKEWTIKAPLVLVPAQQGGFHMLPILMSVDPASELPLPVDKVIFHVEPVDEVADLYRERTTGIKTVRKPGIVLG